MSDQTLTSAEEQRAWREWHDRSTGRCSDLLQLVNDAAASASAGAGSAATAASSTDPRNLVKSDTVIECLRQRWKARQPYTALGQASMVVVNPHDREQRIRDHLRRQKASDGQPAASQEWPLLTMTESDRYLLISDPRDYLPVLEGHHAHPFAMAAKAYWHMLRDEEQQVVTVSGESGSGKTETGKLMIRQLAHLSESYARKLGHALQGLPPPEATSKVIRRLESELEVLERFTSAHTALNPNSTRMHKFVELQFSEHGKLVGAEITEFMLEVMRVAKVTAYGPQEMNFHIFYDLFRAGEFSKEERERYFLPEKPKSLRFLKSVVAKQSRWLYENDPINQQSIKVLLRAAGFNPQQQDDIFKLLSAVLLLGNIEFEDNDATRRDQGAIVKNINVLEDCATLLAVSPDALATALTQKTRIVASTLCADFLNVSQSGEARDQFAITIYQLLVKRIVDDLNRRHTASPKMADKRKELRSIAIFDFGGLEDTGAHDGDTTGARNRFWQFASNFADELVLGWLKERLFADPVAKSSSPEFVSLFDGIKEEALDVSRCTAALFTHPQRGIIRAIDQDTLLLKQSFCTPQQSLDLNDHIGHLFPVRKQSMLAFGAAANRPPHGQAFAHDFRLMERFQHGHTRSSFGVRHYGGVSLRDKDKDARTVKVFYDVGDFMDANRQQHTQIPTYNSDFVRLISGTADFAATGNNFFRSLLPSLPALSMDSPGDRRVSLRASIDKDKSDTSGATVLEMKADGNFGSAKFSRKTSVVSTKTAGRQRKSFVEAHGDTTAIAQLSHDITGLFSAIEKCKRTRFWNVFCVRPSIEVTAGKFSEEKVREQIKRMDIALLILRLSGSFSKSMSWVDFFNRYHSLKPFPARNFDVNNRRDYEKLRELCSELYKMFGAVFRGGNGRVIANEDVVLLDERAWWSLERNLSFLQTKSRLRHTVDPSREGTRWEYESIASDGSDMEGADMEERIRREAVLNRKRKGRNDHVKLSPQRTWWLKYTWLFSWWIPDGALHYLGSMRRADVRLAWREKFALCCTIFFISMVTVFFVAFLTKFLCPDTMYTVEEAEKFLRPKGYIIVHGEIFNRLGYTKTKNPVDFSTMESMDASEYFPFTTASGALVTECNPTGLVFGEVAKCHGRNDCLETKEFFKLANDQKNGVRVESGLVVKYFGPVARKTVQILEQTKNNNKWIRFGQRVYNVTELIQNKLMYPQWDIAALESRLGTDVQKELPKLSGDLLKCLNTVYFIGLLDGRDSDQCVYSGYTLTAMMVINCLIIVIKFLTSMQLGTKRRPENLDRYCILQVPCYTEDEASLKKTINSISVSEYDDEKKLLLIVADGLIKGSGNDRMTPEIVLGILGVPNASEQLTSDDACPRFSYIALGDGSNRLNYAKVFSGRYKIQDRHVPFMVIVKVGKESESRRPGNRGKRDSQLILMKFLNKVFFDKRMMPLELEIYRQMRDIIGVEPAVYEYCLMVDADTEVMPDALNRLVAFMLNDTLTMGLCGETQIGNESASWVTAIQVFEYFISHHLAKAFESLFGSVTCLPGCFSMYRIKSPGKRSIPLIVADEIIDEYEENVVDTLHKKNLFSLGEDRYLTTLMLKQFPGYRNKFTPDAACKTIVPDEFGVLLSQRRRWINSTVHNLWELMLVPHLCGCLCFGMRFIVFMDLIGTVVLPVTLCYLGYLVYLLVTMPSAQYVMVSIYALAGTYALQAVVFMMRMKFDMLVWMFIYILSMPIFGFVLPLYSFWHFDDFSWGNTRVAAGEKGGAGHGGDMDGEVFNVQLMEQRTWAEYCQANGLPLSVSDSPDQKVNMATAKSVKLQSPTMLRKPSARPTPLKTPAAAVQRGTALPPAPQSARLDGDVDSPLVEYFSKDWQEGIPKLLLPLPLVVSRPLARVVTQHVMNVFQAEEGSKMTKKAIRDRVEKSLRLTVASYDEEENMAGVPADMRALMVENLDLSTDPERREWINKCIVLLFQENVQKRMMKK